MNYREQQPWDRARLAEISEQRHTIQTGTELTPFGYGVSLLAVSLICAALIVIVLSVVLVMLLGLSFWMAWRVALFFAMGPLVLAIWGALKVIYITGEAAIERLVGQDLNRSGGVGDMPAMQHTTRIEVSENRNMRFLDIPMEPAKIQIVAKLALAGRLSERDMAGVMSRHAWGDTRRQLLEADLVQWRNERDPRGGLTVTGKGKQVFEGLLLEDGSKHGYTS